MSEPVHVEIAAEGKLAKVMVNGVDLANGVQSYTITHASGERPELTLSPIAVTGWGNWVGDVDRLNVYLPDEARTALIAAGWTPPPNENVTEGDAPAQTQGNGA